MPFYDEKGKILKKKGKYYCEACLGFHISTSKKAKKCKSLARASSYMIGKFK